MIRTLLLIGILNDFIGKWYLAGVTGLDIPVSAGRDAYRDINL